MGAAAVVGWVVVAAAAAEGRFLFTGTPWAINSHASIADALISDKSRVWHRAIHTQTSTLDGYHSPKHRPWMNNASAAHLEWKRTGPVVRRTCSIPYAWVKCTGCAYDDDGGCVPKFRVPPPHGMQGPWRSIDSTWLPTRSSQAAVPVACPTWHPSGVRAVSCCRCRATEATQCQHPPVFRQQPPRQPLTCR